MGKTNHYSFTTIPLRTEMTVREFREAIAGEDGNFSILDTVLAGIDIVTCSIDESDTGYVLKLTRKNGTSLSVSMPDMGDVKTDEMHDITEGELNELWTTVFGE